MKPEAVLIDVDGTVAIRNTGPGCRGPYDMDRVGEDAPNLSVVRMVQLIAVNGPGEDVALIFVSGRDGSARKATQQWLERYFPPGSFYLYMREENDMRPDETIKFELLRELQKTWTIIATFDDRNRVVDMWRDNGITCFQVCSREAGEF